MHTLTKVAAFSIAGAVLFGAEIASAQQAFSSPLRPEFNSLQEFVSGALKVMIMVAMPIISLFLVYSGFLFVFAQGNQEQLAKAKTNFIYVILGSILILGAWVFASLLGNTVTELTR